MDFWFKVIRFTLCIQIALCSAKTYKAAYVREDVPMDSFTPLIYKASEMNADILVLPSPEVPRSENLREIYSADKSDEVIKNISDASKKGKLYVVAHILEEIRCQGQQEIIRNNLVFDREGSIIAVYKKPLHHSTNCNITNSVAGTFTTDFGVVFGLLMEEDLVIKNVEDVKRIKNFVLTGKSSTNIPYLSANEFASGWTYVTNANIVSSKGIFVGKAGLKTGTGKVVVTELLKNGDEDPSVIHFNGQTKLTNFPGEDLSQYTIRPLDIEASARGYRETVCHDKFCCDFHVKTSFLGNPKEVNYGLVVFNGMQNFDSQTSIGMQSCALLACTGLYKRSCFLSSENTTNIVFDEVSISGNFTKSSSQFPIIQSTVDTILGANQFNMKENSVHCHEKNVIIELFNAKDVLRFGIFGRDYSKDFKIRSFERNAQNFEDSNYISSENVEEFFDYLWIRLRFVIFVVSIYILEMI